MVYLVVSAFMRIASSTSAAMEANARTINERKEFSASAVTDSLDSSVRLNVANAKELLCLWVHGFTFFA